MPVRYFCLLHKPPGPIQPMVLAVLIIHEPPGEKCELVLHRSYQNDVPLAEALLALFCSVYDHQDALQKCPFLLVNGISYVYVASDNGLFYVAVSRRNINAMATVTFLHHFSGILFQYFSDVDRDAVVDNTVLVYELLDECVDFGVVQLTEYNILKEYIKVLAVRPRLHYEDDDLDLSDDHRDVKKPDLKKKKKDKVTSTHNQAVKTRVMDSELDLLVNSSILRASSLAINWRPKGIFYAKNEIYIDIVENCDFYYDLGTNLIKRNEIHGLCLVKSYLSGMPSCKLGFNETNMSRIEYDGDNESALEETGQQPEPSVRDDNQLLVEPEEDDDDLVSQAVDGSTNLKTSHKVPIRNVQFHQCIELGSVYKDKIIRFIPPDDKFTLMTYHVEQQKQKHKLPLIMIKPVYRVFRESRKLHVLCTLTTNFKKRRHCQNLLVKIPINPHIFSIDHNSKSPDDDLKYKAELGDVSYKIDSSELFWKIDDLSGAKKSVKMMAELTLVDAHKIDLETINDTLHNRVETQNELSEEEFETDIDSAKKELDKYYGVNGASSSLIIEIQKKLKLVYKYNDISFSFSIPMLTYSGLRLTYLRVDEDQMKYTCFPWVRYITQSSTNMGGTGGSKNKDYASQNCTYRFKLGINCFQL